MVEDTVEDTVEDMVEATEGAMAVASDTAEVSATGVV
jgi:hypothetical protein